MRQANWPLASSPTDIHSGVSDDRLSPLPARARAVADAPSEELAARAEELARRWALAIVGARPLSEMAGVPLEELARFAPALCAAVARALSSDRELASFEVGAADQGGRTGTAVAGLEALAGGWDAAAAVEHVEALRGVLWRAALEELRDPSARQVADLSDRLASVCAAVLGHALAERSTAVRDDVPRPGFVAPREQVLYSAPPGPLPGAVGAVLIDERDDAQRSARPRASWRRDDGPTVSSATIAARARSPQPPGGSAPPGPSAPSAPSASRTAPRPLPWDTPLQSSAAPRTATGPDPAEGGPTGEDPVMRVRRGPGAPADRRLQ